MPAYPRHLETFDYRGAYRYSLTFCTFERRRTFVHADTVALVHDQISRALSQQQFTLHVYCYMPDHVHLLVEGSSDHANLRTVIARAKQYSGFYFKCARSERLWQRYGYERVLRGEDDSLTIARYIVANPVRALLAQSPLDYPFWGSSTWTKEELIDYVRTG